MEHPTQDVLGKMVWQTTASVIRLEIMSLEQSKKVLDEFKESEWNIECNAKGQISLVEL